MLLHVCWMSRKWINYQMMIAYLSVAFSCLLHCLKVANEIINTGL